jgi:hypothetical protein
MRTIRTDVVRDFKVRVYEQNGAYRARVDESKSLRTDEYETTKEAFEALKEKIIEFDDNYLT